MQWWGVWGVSGGVVGGGGQGEGKWGEGREGEERRFEGTKRKKVGRRSEKNSLATSCRQCTAIGERCAGGSPGVYGVEWLLGSGGFF